MEAAQHGHVAQTSVVTIIPQAPGSEGPQRMGLVPGTRGSIESGCASLFEQLCSQRPEIEKSLVARIRNVSSDSERRMRYLASEKAAELAVTILQQVVHG